MSSAEISKKSARVKPAHHRRILLIDDHVESLVPLNLILGHLGITVSLVFDGFAAKRALEAREFDLVVIDWNMPGLSGGECLTYADDAISNRRTNRHSVPFVVYSGLRENEVTLPELTHFYSVGHWRKPMRLSELTQRLTAVLERLEKAA